MDRDPQPQPTLAQLLARCDFARLHPDRLARNTERWQLAETEGLQSDICSADEADVD